MHIKVTGIFYVMRIEIEYFLCCVTIIMHNRYLLNVSTSNANLKFLLFFQHTTHAWCTVFLEACMLGNGVANHTNMPQKGNSIHINCTTSQKNLQVGK